MTADKLKTIYHLNHQYRDKAWQLLEKLFPIYRTVLGAGYQKSLEIIRGIIPIKIIEFSSGGQCGSWTIPQEWQISDAFIADSQNRKIVDFQSNPFQLWQYSMPIDEAVDRAELLKHIISRPESPAAVPLAVTYYKKNWGFCLSQHQLNKLRDKLYQVKINSQFKPGNLQIGELYLAGSSPREIIIDAVLSCPSLANNLSGVAAAVCLAELIAGLKERNFSYRILFTPETIGPISLHYRIKNFGRQVIGGYNLINLADDNIFHYKKSRPGNTLADTAMMHSLKFSGQAYEIEDYHVRSGSCGNEKVYNSLGIELPIGAFRRSPLGSYPEYDTDLDNLQFINKDKLFSSLQVVWGAIQAIERSRFYKHNFEGEPFLTGCGLLPKIANDQDRLSYDYLMGFTSGNLTLVDIADKAGLAVSAFDQAVELMTDKGLLKEIIPPEADSAS